MAAATTLNPTINLKTQSSYPVRLGTSILKPAESKKWTSVRYNHKPRLEQSDDIRSSIRPGKTGHGEDLMLKSGKEEYTYSGKDVSDGEYYVLLCADKGSGKGLVLEELEGCHEFNLVKTLSETDAARLAARFPHIPLEPGNEESGDDLFGDGDDAEQPADPSNPWDYRNYLKSDMSKTRDRQAESKESKPSTPQVQPRGASSTPISRPAKRSGGPLVSQKKRKAQPDNIKPTPKRVKAGTEPPPPSVSDRAKPRAQVPKVQGERKATLRRPSLDDSGELILENETPVSEKLPPRQSAMALALSGQLGPGPISLHSAANSPASKVASPEPTRPEDVEEGEEFEFGSSSSSLETPVKGDAARRHVPDDEDDADADEEDEDADADVEDFELPSPAQTHRKSVSAAADSAGADDDDDDLDKQLALAMAEDDGDEGSVQGGTAPAVVNGSEEESEEE